MQEVLGVSGVRIAHTGSGRAACRTAQRRGDEISAAAPDPPARPSRRGCLRCPMPWCRSEVLLRLPISVWWAKRRDVRSGYRAVPARHRHLPNQDVRQRVQKPVTRCREAAIGVNLRTSLGETPPKVPGVRRVVGRPQLGLGDPFPIPRPRRGRVAGRCLRPGPRWPGSR